METFDAEPGRAVPLAEGLWRVLAPNPSPMTGPGTNSFVLSDGGACALIDPGPDDPAHLDALLAAIAPVGPLEAILVTHAHRDHAPLATGLARVTGAPILAFGPAAAGRSSVMQALADAGLTAGGEGVDTAFAPDRQLADGEQIVLGGTRIEALHTPGHMGNHLAFRWGGHLFCGDQVMGWSSTLISPPDGDLSDFLTSCAKLRDLAAADPGVIFHPAHGAPLGDPVARLDWLVAHRLERETQILDALGASPGRVPDLTARIYGDLATGLIPAAQRNVLAHLIHLHGKGAVTASPQLETDAIFDLAQGGAVF